MPYTSLLTASALRTNLRCWPVCLLICAVWPSYLPDSYVAAIAGAASASPAIASPAIASAARRAVLFIGDRIERRDVPLGRSHRRARAARRGGDRRRRPP